MPHSSDPAAEHPSPVTPQTEAMHPLAAQYFHEMLMRAGMLPFRLPPKVAWLVASDIWATLPHTDVQGNIYGAPVYEVPGLPDGMIRLVGATIDGSLNARALDSLARPVEEERK